MTPKLTYTATVQPNGDVTIVLGNWTGEYQRGSQKVFRATNDVYIYSCYTPEWSPGENFLYVHGQTACTDHIPIHIPAADWQRVKQALDEYGAAQANAEQTKETKVCHVVEGPLCFFVNGSSGEPAATLHKSQRATRADADELCAKLNARADAERKATEVRVDYVDNGVHLYIGDRKWPNCCVGFSCGDGDGITKAQAHKLAAATAEALRGILRGESN